MKSVAVLAVISCLALGLAMGIPVPEQDTSKTINVLVETGRQAVAPAAAPAATDDDDDDDDDDEDGIEDLIEEDDDDEDDDDDDGDDKDDEEDSGDYIERFIDDILGGDEDDDDDDETSSVVEPVVPAAPVPAQIAQPSVPAIPASVQADLNAFNAEAAAEDAANVAEASAIESESASYEDEEIADVPPEGQAASNLENSGVEGVESQASPAISTNQIAPAPVQVVTAPPASEEDDDDDEDDDDLDISELGGEDDDDDDDDDDDEDDDDDDDDDDVDGIEAIADARRARAMDSEPANHVPAIYVAKYNRFVDNILGRINKILRTNYDPVTVKLSNPNTSTKSSKTKLKKKSTKKSKHGSKKSATGSIGENVDKSLKESTTSSALKDVKLASTTEGILNAVPDAVVTTPRTLEPITVQKVESRNAASTSTKKPKRKRTKNKTKTKSKAPVSSSTKNKTKSKKSSKPKARATLYGLSSLKRSGDVSVNMMRDHTTIKTKFSLGPLVLKVEKEFGRATKKELRSATATTAEMSGKLSLRVLHGGAATLHSIRVLQPKQVRVDSVDDHDRTREFVWKRSSHIAHLVSQKLSSATRSMLRPPPILATAA